MADESKSADAGADASVAPLCTFVAERTECTVACAECGQVVLPSCTVAERGHNWAGKPSVVYDTPGKSASTDEVIGAVSLPHDSRRDLKLIQGTCTVADAKCALCGTNIGWAFVTSCVDSQHGKIGLMSPCVKVTERTCEDLLASLAPAKGSGGPDASMAAHALTFMAQHCMTGLSVAYSRADADAPVVARAWGTACPGQPLTPDHAMRVASISKTLTAVAVLQLEAAGKLDLDAPVLPLLERRLDTSLEVCDERMRSITVRQLLHHTGGGWDNKEWDAMFALRHLGTHCALITHVLAKVPLDRDPGVAHAYSNFGYCLLGRVIEAVDGRSYVEYVQQQVLGPSGVSEAGASCSEPCDGDGQRRCAYFAVSAAPTPGDDGVPKYTVRVDSEEPSKLTNWMDAHGGWVLTPTALVQFSRALSAGTLLPKASYDAMITPHECSGNYGLGVFVNTHARWHAGLLRHGTNSILVHTTSNGGVTWALVANCDAAGGKGDPAAADKAWGPDALDQLGWQLLPHAKELW